MATPTQIRAALAAQINAAIPGLRIVTDASTVVSPPVIIVLPAQGTYINYLVAEPPGMYDITIRVVVLVSMASERAQLPILDAYLAPSGPSSIPAAILADPTLGNITDYCIPSEASGPAEITWSEVAYLGAEITCTAGAE